MSERSVLGRGVGALLPDEAAETADERYFFCDIDKIQPNPNQPRTYFDAGRLDELAESIREKGIIQPLLATRGADGRYTLVAGERRLRAAKQAGLEEVPVILMDEGGQDESLELALIENIQRQDLNPIEEAMAYARLMEEFHLTQEEVGRKVGRQRSTITNTLRLLALPEAIRRDVAAGAVSEGHARALLRIKDDAERLQAVRERIVNEGLSVRATERLCSRGAGSGGSGAASSSRQSNGLAQPEGLPASHLQDLTEQLAGRLHTRVRIVQQGQRGKLEIEYYSRDDLERLIGLIVA